MLHPEALQEPSKQIAKGTGITAHRGTQGTEVGQKTMVFYSVPLCLSVYVCELLRYRRLTDDAVVVDSGTEELRRR